MRRRTFLALFAAFAATPALAEESPRDIVARIYALAAGKDGKYDGPSVIDNKEARTRYLAKSLDQLIQKAFAKSRRINEPIIDFDPVLNTQDPEPPKGLVFVEESAGADKATVVAKWSMYGQPTFVRYDLVRENGAWKVFDLRGGEGKDAWSLRKIAVKG